MSLHPFLLAWQDHFFPPAKIQLIDATDELVDLTQEGDQHRIPDLSCGYTAYPLEETRVTIVFQSWHSGFHYDRIILTV